MPTIPLAVYDSVPVVLTAVGLYWIWRSVAAACPSMSLHAIVGAALVVAGGTAKALWKLVLAVSDGSTDLVWLSDGLFVLMAPGFVLIASAVWGSTRAVRYLPTRPPRLLGPALAAGTLVASAALAVLVPDSIAWSRVLLGVMVLAVLALNTILVAISVRRRMTAVTVLFALNILGTLALNAMARAPAQTVALQWVEQTVNTASWLAFAAAAYLLHQSLFPHSSEAQVLRPPRRAAD